MGGRRGFEVDMSSQDLVQVVFWSKPGQSSLSVNCEYAEGWKFMCTFVLPWRIR